MAENDRPTPPTGPPVPPPAAAPHVQEPPRAPGIADARNNPPPAPRDRKEPRRHINAPTPTSNGLPPALRLVSSLSYYTNEDRRLSMFIPCAISLFAMLYELDHHMVNTYRFLQSAPDWHPLISQLYIAVLFYVHVLRAQRESGNLAPQHLAFLRDFESVYDPRNLHIPGPLVPFFASLTYSSGPNEWFGDVSPGIPSNTNAQRDHAYMLRNNLMMNLPSISLIMDQLQWLFSLPRQGNNAVTNELAADSFYSNIFGQAASNTGNARFNMLTPNARYHVYMVPDQLGIFRSRSRYFNFPARLNLTTSRDFSTFANFMRFTEPGTHRFFNWFDYVSRIMQRYCQFVRHTSNLQATSPTGLGASSIVIKYQLNPSLVPENVSTEDIPGTGDSSTTPPTRPTPRYVLQTPTNFKYTAEHADPEIEELAEQFALLSAVNVDWSLNPANDVITPPTSANSREGPIWELRPIRISPTVDPTRGYGTIISSEYHSDARITSRD